MIGLLETMAHIRMVLAMLDNWCMPIPDRQILISILTSYWYALDKEAPPGDDAAAHERLVALMGTEAADTIADLLRLGYADAQKKPLTIPLPHEIVRFV